MSKAAEIAKRYYDAGTWKIDRLKTLVARGAITEDEYKEITGEDYAE